MARAAKTAGAAAGDGGQRPVVTAGPDSRAPVLFPLFRSLADLPGVGPGLVTALARLTGRETPRVLDLLFTVPASRRDLGPLTDAMAFEEGLEATLEVAIVAHRAPPPGGRAPYRIEARACDVALDLVFFRARRPWLEEAFPPGGGCSIAGRLQRFRDRWQIVHPELLPADPAARLRASLVYPLSEGLTQARLRKLVATALKDVPSLPEWSDPSTMSGRPSFVEALAIVHGLDEAGDPREALERLAADEMLAMQLALQLVRRRREAGRGRSHPAPGALLSRLRSALPFAPTGAQERTMREIAADLEAPRAMMRLLMGDVGSGKTLVALAAMLHVVEAGRQAVLMAPTEVLARQHARSLGALAAACGLELGVLTGQDTRRMRDQARARLADGSLPLVVGTHALFQEGVDFHDLGLAVIDEQHRFGVHQRLGLLAKGGEGAQAVDLLLMTATPIPRSLVMSCYGDIDTSRLDERPPGRKPIGTAALPVTRLDEVLAAIERALQRDERVYWICPVVDTALDAETATAEGRYAQLAERFGSRVGLVHGRLPAGEKDRRMRAFEEGRIRLLVATTVVEVGVDVPEATVIVIDGAERFGLSQLHQLRGRVGRGVTASTCLMLYGTPLSRHARARLAIMRETDDGFRIAEEDLRLRGPGELLGVRQSGLPRLCFADLTDAGDALSRARDEARRIVDRDPQLALPRGAALALLLQLFERGEAHAMLDAG